LHASARRDGAQPDPFVWRTEHRDGRHGDADRLRQPVDYDLVDPGYDHDHDDPDHDHDPVEQAQRVLASGY
jgi:hypothetical protein